MWLQADQKKRVMLSKLPETLLIQCKRFVFDFDAMMQVKLNTRYACCVLLYSNYPNVRVVF